MNTTPRILALLLVLALAGEALAESPTLSRIAPRGGQRGTEIDVVFSGTRLRDAQEILFYQSGIEVVKLEPQKNNTQVKVRFRIAQDAPLGEHPMRVRTATGISELRTFFVGTFPTVAEKEPNSEFETPQKIGLNVTVTGVVQSEDVDYYAVEVKKGQRITAEVEGIRLGMTLFDSFVAILDSKRFELATCDDSSLFLQDPVASIVAPEDGTYVIQVRESSYGGNGNCLYRLHVGTFPRPMVVYPPGGKAGEELQVRYIGDVKGDITQKLKLPAERQSSYRVFAEQNGETPPSPNVIRVSDFPNVLEAEPNNGRKEATKTDLPLPVALNGIIEKPGDEDWFRFKAKKGRRYYVRVYARQLRSPLDPVTYIFKAGGGRVESNDDQGGPDSGFRFQVPEDGEYELLIRDHLRGGGPAYVYRVEFLGDTPSVFTHIPSYAREPRGQTRQWVVVPKGNRFCTWIRVNRRGFGGDMKLEFEGLPEGITAHCDTIAANIDRVPVVFEAAPDAKVAGGLVDVVAKVTDPKRQIEGGFYQRVNLVFGPPNNRVYYSTDVRKLGVAVSEEAPFKIRIIQPKVPLVQNGSMNLKVVAEKKEGWDNDINVRLLWKPPGIGARSSIKIPKGKTEGYYPINANGGAQTRTWKIAMLGYAGASNGTAYVSSQLADLAVATPYVGLKIAMAATEQGKPADLVCSLEQLKAFEGKAKVILHGLPAKVTADAREKEITRADKEVVFHLKTDPKTPKGQHKSVFCQIVVPENGESIVHNTGRGVLRVDPPPPAPKKPKAAPKKPVAAKKPAATKPQVKRLTRLEKLRLEAEKRAKEEANQQQK